MHYPVKPIYLKEFVVVSFKSKHLDPAIQRWKAGSEAIAAESCSRQVWYGLQEDFDDFPARGNQAINFYEGAEAYDFMLRLYSGMESAKVLEDSIKGQICGSWEVFRAESDRKQKAIDTIMQDMKADYRFINGAVLSGYQHYKHEISARDLSGQQKGETALLIGSVNRHNHAGQYTDGIARVIGNKKAGRVSDILVTHPDPKQLRIIHDSLLDLKNKGIVAAKIERVPFSDLGRVIEKSDRVYVDLPMGSAPDAEEDMILHWMGRVYKGNTLTHLRGNPDLQGSSTPLWQEANLDNFISPEDIRADMAARGRNNKAVLETARATILHCAEMRMAGEAPSHAKVKAFVKEYTGPALAVA